MNKRAQSAEKVLAAMIGVLAARRAHKLRRIQFLKLWGWLRKLLAETPEYQLWKHIVKERAGGACERCGKMGHHAHHKVQVSRDPSMALDPENGEYLCKQEHNEEHDGKLLRPRRPRSDARPTHRSPTVLRIPDRPARSFSEPTRAPNRRAQRDHRMQLGDMTR